MANDDWRWWWGDGTEPEHLHAGTVTRAEALADAGLQGSPGDVVTICQGRRIPLKDDFLDADRVLEWWSDANEELADEDGDLRMAPTQAQKIELESALNDAFKAWRAKHNLGRAWALETKGEEVITLPPVVEVEASAASAAGA